MLGRGTFGFMDVFRLAINATSALNSIRLNFPATPDRPAGQEIIQPLLAAGRILGFTLKA
jgi:hypothetical protein